MMISNIYSTKNTVKTEKVAMWTKRLHYSATLSNIIQIFLRRYHHYKS